MGVLDTCTAEEDPLKNEGARVVIKRSHIVQSFYSMQIFYDAKGKLNQLRLVLPKVQSK